METTLIVRIILIITSSLSLILQILGLTGRGWYGFSLSIDTMGVKIHEHMQNGLFYFSPLEVCVDQGNGTVCKSPEEFPPDARQLFDVANNTVKESISLLRFLAITGTILSVIGLILLYIYLCKKSNRQRCMGIVCAVAWMSAALFELIATGIQVSRNRDTKNGFLVVEMTLEKKGIQMQAECITAWATIIFGIGAAWASIVALLVALTTCGKKFSKTVILYRELKENDKALMLEQGYEDD